jgi:hypothetical protein
MADWSGLAGAGGQLALQILQRQNEAKALYDKLATEGRARAQARLSAFGTPDEAFMSQYETTSAPATTQALAMSDALKNYVVGLPALLVNAYGRSGSGGGDGTVPSYQAGNPMDLLPQFRPAAPAPTRPAGTTGLSADAIERQMLARRRAQQPPAQQPPAQALRPEYL